MKMHYVLIVLIMLLVSINTIYGCKTEVPGSITSPSSSIISTDSKTTAVTNFTDTVKIINTAVGSEFVIIADVDYQGITYDQIMLTLLESRQEFNNTGEETFHITQLFNFKALKNGSTEVTVTYPASSSKTDLVFIVNIK
jgi:hypothetical protein